jgi:hypothetical protein
MKSVFFAIAMSLVLASSSAFAFHCPKDMKAIDAALAEGPSLTTAQMSKVKELRAKGEAEHKAGQHQAAVDSLAEAMKILGVK